MLCYAHSLCKAPCLSRESQQLNLVLPPNLPLLSYLRCITKSLAHRREVSDKL